MSGTAIDPSDLEARRLRGRGAKGISSTWIRVSYKRHYGLPEWAPLPDAEELEACRTIWAGSCRNSREVIQLIEAYDQRLAMLRTRATPEALAAIATAVGQVTFLTGEVQPKEPYRAGCAHSRPTREILRRGSDPMGLRELQLNSTFWTECAEILPAAAFGNDMKTRARGLFWAAAFHLHRIDTQPPADADGLLRWTGYVRLLEQEAAEAEQLERARRHYEQQEAARREAWRQRQQRTPRSAAADYWASCGASDQERLEEVRRRLASSTDPQDQEMWRSFEEAFAVMFGASGRRPSPDHQLLGVDPGVSAEELKAAFRAKAKEHHPDLGGNHQQFVAIAAAYERLQSRG